MYISKSLYRHYIGFPACPLNTYGDQCLSKCGHCVGNATCNPEDGVCPEGCRDGYIGAKCNQIEKFIMPASNDVFDLFDLKLKFYSCLRLF